MHSTPGTKQRNKWSITIISFVILICLGTSIFIADLGILAPVLVIAISCGIALQICFIQQPKTIIWMTIFYIFTFGILGREVGGFPYGTLQEVILLMGWLTIIFTAHQYDWKVLNNDFVWLLTIWLIVSVLEVANPAGASPQGWLQEIRAAALYPFLIVPLGFLLLKKNKDLNTFLYLIIGLSLLASFNGLKQMYIGLSPGEQKFLDDGAANTHLIWGKLRVFSFYSDAGQFGASQAHIGLITLILCLGPFKWWKKALLFIASMIMIYGMLISGTRGALFALIIGLLLALVLSKKFKVMIIGGAVALAFIGFLKFTNIGDGNYQIFRLRTALDPKEASLNVRLMNQQILRDYLASRPFGGGLGVIGVWGETYNKDKFLSTVQPDSYWVKVWAMYGIVGFILWFCIMMYILGKCCGIVWKTEDQGLRIKTMALTSGYAGILFCSYANEVINTAPSSFVVYISWVLVFISPKIEEEIRNQHHKSLKPKI
ncbi:O-antigen ligase family protein [Pedobacter gandavensis]|uniref:O-antigen ligase family protein n=1 Tax=Pedobacter gandavensis TaxID=2679963 RepID=UPI002931ACB7|nr:O-antigen ligase family protein [Pedobacter gandavensis]